MQDTDRTILIAVVIALFGLAVYQLGIRPANIRKGCSDEATSRSVRAYPYDREQDTTRRTELQEALEEKLYNNCLAERGLAR